jgi:hypothetical protein
MKELYIEGLANHDDHESCIDFREGVCEALTVARVGWVLSPEKSRTSTPTPFERQEGNISNVVMRDITEAGVVGDPMHARKLCAREPGGPMFDRRG